ncbi:MAG: Cellulase (glycosyl hydrolase family 5) [candidate division BRC1 bacterium ADurb.BinA364]|nr:MAG: Cellulase (glycosyl hydrolase family 5) [candidate division BRC1 bacterium ADurb.BinA364]
MTGHRTLLFALAYLAGALLAGGAEPAEMPWIAIDSAGTGFSRDGEAPFRVWGFNYDHDAQGRLIEDYWEEEWKTVVGDFREMKALGANAVRVHLQVAKFIESPDRPNEAAFKRLGRLVRLAERTGLYLDITGLGCYHKQDVPAWYDALGEQERWAVQALFWKSTARTCAASPAILCYDLMNEPILPGAGKPETEWLAGEFGGKHFVQRITLDLADRTREQVARAWVDLLVSTIREEDKRHLITVGVIPWAMVWPNAKPFFNSPEVGKNLDYVSAHFYPKKGEVDKALQALKVYDIGKPLVVEEMFPLACGLEELNAFIDGSRDFVDGYIGFYWGKTIEEYASEEKLDIGGAIMKGWLEYFQAKAPEMTN